MSYSDRLRRERATYAGQPDVPARDDRINQIRARGIRSVEEAVRNIHGAESFDTESDRRDAEMDRNPVRAADRASPDALRKLRHMVASDADSTIEGRLSRIEDMVAKLYRKHG